MAKLANRAKMGTSTTGTGTITLGTAKAGFLSFADAGISDGDVVRYVIEDGDAFEIGTGTYTASGTTLSRTVSESSNSDAAIDLSGNDEVSIFIAATKDDFVNANEGGTFSGDVTFTGDLTGDLTGTADKADQVYVQATATDAEHKILSYRGTASNNYRDVYYDPEVTYNPITATVRAGGFTIKDEGSLKIESNDESFATSLHATVPTADRDIYLQDADGTLAFDDEATQSAKGLMSSADKTKLDGIEASATADQTGAEIKTAYEAEDDTNAFTDALKTKLDGIETSADVTDTANVTAAGAVMDSELTDEAAVKAINQGLTTTSDVTFNDVAVSGNLTVSGTTTTVNTETINLADNQIVLNSNFTGSTPTEDGGIEINRGDLANKTLVWDETNNRWTVGSETFVAGYFSGDGSNLTNVAASTVNVSESSDDNNDYNVLFGDTDGVGNVQMAPTQDNDGLTFNPYTNTLTVQRFAAADEIHHKSDEDTKISFGTNTITLTGGNVDLFKAIKGTTSNALQALVPMYYSKDSYLVFEGATNDDHELTIQVVDPTADRTITFPDATGTVALTDDLYTDSDVDTHLNTSTATTGQYLSWDGSDYDWAAVPEGYADGDVDTHLNTSTATSNQVLSWDGTDYAWVDDSDTTYSNATTTTDGLMSSTDKTKLDGVEESADVTDTDNVVAALTAGTNVTIAADGTISSTDTNTTYSNATTSTDGLMSSSDKTKLNGIEESADVTDTNNVVAALTAGTNVTIAADGTISSTDTNTTYSNATTTTDGLMSSTDKEKLDGIEESADVTDTNNVVAALTAGTNVTIAADGTISSTDTNTTYSNATQSADGLMSSTDKEKLDGIETGADVTDTDSVTAAGALMDSEVTNLAQVKAFDSSDYAAASHNHDDRYYTETEADNRFVNVTGDTMTGALYLGSADYIEGDATASSGMMISSGQDVEVNFNTNDMPNPGDAFVVTHGSSRDQVFKVDGTAGTIYANGSNKVFHDGYHPNADKWTTSRTLSLTGDVTGSVSVDGSANASIATTITDTALDDRYQKISDKEFFSITNSGTVAGTWLGSHDDITAYFDGMTIAFYQNGLAGASTTTININSLGAKTIYHANDSKLTTHYGSRALIMLQYDSDQDRFYAHDFYYSDYNSYQRFTTDITVNNSAASGVAVHGYQLLLEGYDGKFYPVTEGGSTANTNAVSTAKLKLGGLMLQYEHSTDYNANATLTRNELYVFREGSNMEYWNNRDSGWATADRPVYLVGTVQTDGSWKLDNTSYTSFLTQTLPTTDDGKIYVQIGLMGDNYDNFHLFNIHPIFIYKDGGIKTYAGYSEYAADAGKWATSRTLTLSGDASGSVSWDGSDDATLSVTVANDSHNHNHSDGSFTVNGTVQATGGANIVSTSSSPFRWQRSTLSQTGQDDNVTVHVDDSNIYFTHNNDDDGDASGFHFRRMTGGSAQNLLSFNSSEISYKGQNIFRDDYHPNADKWTTARTLSLTGEVTGSVSWDGSANASISTTLTDSPDFSTSLTVDGHTLQNSADRSGLLEIDNSLGSVTGVQFKFSNSALWSMWGDQDDFIIYDDYNSEIIMRYNENSTLEFWSNGTEALTVGEDYIEITGEIRHKGDTDTRISFPIGGDSMLFYTGGTFVASMSGGNIDIPNAIRHHNDTNTYMQFHANDSWRVVAGNTEHLEVTTSGVRVSNAFTLPTSDGSQNQVLTTDGNGNTSWATSGGGGGATVIKSTETSYASMGTFGLSYSHGQSSAPDMVYLQLLIKTPEDNWSTGDVINIYSTAEFDETDYVLNCYGNSSVIGVQYNEKSLLLRAMPMGPGGAGGSTADIMISDTDHRYRLVGVWF